MKKLYKIIVTVLSLSTMVSTQVYASVKKSAGATSTQTVVKTAVSVSTPPVVTTPATTSVTSSVVAPVTTSVTTPVTTPAITSGTPTTPTGGLLNPSTAGTLNTGTIDAATATVQLAAATTVTDAQAIANRVLDAGQQVLAAIWPQPWTASNADRDTLQLNLNNARTAVKDATTAAAVVAVNTPALLTALQNKPAELNAASASVTAFNALTGVQYPVFSNDLNNKMQQFTQLFTTLSAYTTFADWQKALDLYDKQVVSPVKGMSHATVDQLELAKVLTNTLVSTVSLAYSQMRSDTTDGQQKRNLLSPAVGKLNDFIAVLTNRTNTLLARRAGTTGKPVAPAPVGKPAAPKLKVDVLDGKRKVATEPTVAERRALDAAGKLKLGDRDQMQQFKALFLVLSRMSAGTVIEQACKLFIEKALTPAGQLTTVKLFDLQDIKAASDILVTTLAGIVGQLDANETSMHALVTKQLQNISGLSDVLATRIAAQQVIATALADLARLAADRIDDRITGYDGVFARLDVHTLDDLKNETLKGIADLAGDVQSRGGSNTDKFKQLINRAQGLACFSHAQKKVLAALLSDRPAIKTKDMVVQTSQDAGKVSPYMEAKLKDVYDNSKTGAEKCAIARELIAMITPSASVADKNKVTTLCTQLFMIMGAMALSQLQDVQQVLRDALGNAYLLSPAQRPSMEQWIKTLEFAKQFADVTRPLIDCVKQYIADYRINLTKALDAAYLGISLLGTKIAPAELDKMKPESLFALLRDKLTLFYQARNTKNLEVINDIRRVIEAASMSDSLKSFVGKDWLDQMSALMQLLGIQAQKTYSERLQQYEAFGKTLKTLGSYEKSIMLTDLATIFTSRHERAQKELDAFVKVIDVLVADTKIFDAKDRAQLATWKKFLQVDTQLMAVPFEPDFSKKIDTINQLLPLLGDKQMDHERDLLVMVLRAIYAERGNESDAMLDTFTTLLRKVRNTPGLLFARQASDVDQWSQELVFAKQAAAGATTYLQGLLALAQKMKNIDYYTRALDLFTSKTPQVRVNELVGGLNVLVQAYASLDSDNARRGLGPLLVAMHGKLIITTPLLTTLQREAVAKILGMMRLKLA